MADVRMGIEPRYVFTFAVGEMHGQAQPLQPTERRGSRIDVGRGLAWLWARMWGERVPPLR